MENVRDKLLKESVNQEQTKKSHSSINVLYVDNVIHQININLFLSSHDWFELLKREDFLSLILHLYNQGILRSNKEILEDLGLMEKKVF